MTKAQSETTASTLMLSRLANLAGRLGKDLISQSERVGNEVKRLLPEPVRSVVDDAIERSQVIVIDANKKVGALSTQARETLEKVFTESGREKLAAQLGKEARAIAQQPFRWIDVSMRSDVTALKRRLSDAENNIAALNEAVRSNEHLSIPETRSDP